MPRSYEMDAKPAPGSNDHSERDCSMCQKRIDTTSRKKTRAVVFLIFCCEHGHCMGFHVVANERRRDAFLPLLCYFDKAPDHVFYDFVCSLDEVSISSYPNLVSTVMPTHGSEPDVKSFMLFLHA